MERQLPSRKPQAQQQVPQEREQEQVRFQLAQGHLEGLRSMQSRTRLHVQ
jgi:hypothetical protein